MTFTYEAHSDLLSLLSPALAKAGFDAHLPEALGWWHMHAVSKALQSPLRSASPEVVIKQEKIAGGRARGRVGLGGDLVSLCFILYKSRSHVYLESSR